MDLTERPRDGSRTARRHPWEVARYEFFRRILLDSALRPIAVLDAGAGDGWFSQQLTAALPTAARITCWDAHYTPETLTALRATSSPQLAFTSERPRERFELIMLLDVLEHVEADGAFLAALVRENLAAGGSVLISVPTWQELFTAHDTRLRHFRRYRPSAAARLIEQSGLAIERSGGLFHSLLVPRAAEKMRELLAAPSDSAPASLEWQAGALLTRVVSTALALDNRLSRLASRGGLELPGLSWWALCRAR